jgi:hypothetical protein
MVQGRMCVYTFLRFWFYFLEAGTLDDVVDRLVCTSVATLHQPHPTRTYSYTQRRELNPLFPH